MPTDDFRRFATETWIPALRSGNYRQGQETLVTPHTTYCCLGVLCVLHPDVTWDEQTAIYIDPNAPARPDPEDEEAYEDWIDNYHSETDGELPFLLAHRFGIVEGGDLNITDHDQWVALVGLERRDRHSLIQLNDAPDGNAADFNLIADVIEAALKEDFVKFVR
jgi:hypothetical protein